MFNCYLGRVQAERAEKKAAKQAGKENEKAARGPAFLRLPTATTPSQRARIHKAAGFAGLFHESTGEENERVLCVGDPTAELVCFLPRSP